MPRVLALAAAVLLVGRVLWQADWGRTRSLLAGIGPAAGLLLLPFFAGMALDTLAWRRILRVIGSRVPFVSLLRMRLGSESLTLSAPAGAVASEAVKTLLLARVPGIPMTRAVASVAIKKMVYLLAHGLYLALGLLFGRAAIRAMGVEAGGHPRLVPALYAAATVAMLAVGVALPTAWRRGGPAQLLFRLGRWFPSARLRRWLDGQAAQARAIDGDARTFFTARAGAPVVLLLLLQWLTDVAETYLALRLLRVDVGLYSVLAFEAFNSIARSIAFFLPAGLGVQELNQLWFLRSLGVVQPAAIAAALVILKRSKDLVWTVTGYALLGRAWRAA